MLSRYRPRAPIIAVTRCGQTARQAHLYRGVYPVLYTKAANDVWAEDVDLRVNFALEYGACSCDFFNLFSNRLKVKLVLPVVTGLYST